MPQQQSEETSVETLTLRDGFDIVLSQIAPGNACRYHFVEPQDVFGIGFHLQGGAAFEMGADRFETRSLDIWAGASPQSSDSTFSLPTSGFRTVSLRLAPTVMIDLFDRHGQGGSALYKLAQQASEKVSMVKLGSLSAASTQMIAAMFSTAYTGSARTLYLESCALALLAEQIDAGSRAIDAMQPVDVGNVMAAREWLDAHLDQPPTIVELARIVGTNDFKLKRDFKTAFGTTIFGYVRQRQMERALANLHDGMTVASAALSVGYECPRCFADAFRRHFGILPSEVTRGRGHKIPEPAGQNPANPTRLLSAPV
jgi:AraC-like DNA-binding protein